MLTPAILAAVRKAKVDPLPHLFVCALVANAASFVLPISNPANLVLFDGTMPPLGRWLEWFLVPSVLSILVTYVALRLLFRRTLASSFASEAAAKPLAKSGRYVLMGLGLVTAALLAASYAHVALGLPTLGAALLVVAGTSIATRHNPLRLVRNLSWSTLVLVAGLFVIVEAAEEVGATTLFARVLVWAASHGAAGSIIAAFAVGTLNNVVNILPLGLLTGATLAHAHPPLLLTRALLIGVDLGPNLAVTGSLATLLWLIALR